jgi:hypothetical protein
MGKKDTKVRMRKLIPEQRKEIATEASKSAARARSTKAKKKQWNKTRQKQSALVAMLATQWRQDGKAVHAYWAADNRAAAQ